MGNCTSWRANRYKANVQNESTSPTASLPLPGDDIVTCIASSHNDGEFFCGGDDRLVRLYNFATGEVVRTYSGHKHCINQVAPYSHAGQEVFFTASRDTTIKQWRKTEAEPVETFSGHELTVQGVTASADASLLFSGSRDNTVRLWDVTTAKNISQVNISQNLPTVVRWLPNEHAAVQCSEDLVLRIWDLSGGQIKIAQQMSGATNIPLCCDISSDGRYILTGSKGFDSVGTEAKIWDRRMEKVLREFRGHEQAIEGCVFLESSKTGFRRNMIATASKDKGIRLWDSDSGEQLTFQQPSNSPLTSLSSSVQSNGSVLLFAASTQPSVHVFNVSSQHTLQLLTQSAAA
eukprot:GILK01005438.1.p1 GENE.GILK01005438.1~~GILK01005438.1.p1  ORF type:complete len:347 (-),score=50.62 GILK01005438.1:209-1249(-)